HGAHGYILCAFLSAETNRRTDKWGGPLENRTRLVRDIIAGVRKRCRADFNLGLRLSTERFGLKLGEIRDFAAELMASGDLDYIDLSLWDVFKKPIDAEYQGKSLMSYFTELNRGTTRLGVTGKITSGADARRVLEDGADFAIVGRAAILHHD